MLLRKGVTKECTEDIINYLKSVGIVDVSREDIAIIIDMHVGLLADIIQEQAISIGFDDE